MILSNFLSSQDSGLWLRMESILFVIFKCPASHLSSSKTSKRQLKGSGFGCLAIYKLLFSLKSCWLLKTLPKKKKWYYGHLFLSHYFAVYTPTWFPWTALKRNCRIMLPQHTLGLQSDSKWLLKKIIPFPFIVFKLLHIIVPHVRWETGG